MGLSFVVVGVVARGIEEGVDAAVVCGMVVLIVVGNVIDVAESLTTGFEIGPGVEPILDERGGFGEEAEANVCMEGKSE